MAPELLILGSHLPNCITKIVCSATLLISQIANMICFVYNELGFGTAKPKFVAAQIMVTVASVLYSRW